VISYQGKDKTESQKTRINERENTGQTFLVWGVQSKNSTQGERKKTCLHKQIKEKENPQMMKGSCGSGEGQSKGGTSHVRENFQLKWGGGGKDRYVLRKE